MSTFQSLKKNREFQSVYQAGRSRANRLFIMFILDNGLEDNRVGISVSKKVGNSVVRHRVVRRVREIFRLHWGDVRKGQDIVVVARPSANASDYTECESAVIHLLRLHHLYLEDTGQVSRN